MTSLSGKQFVVTGASSGIGLATTYRLLDSGAEVISLDRNPPVAPVTRHLTVDLADTTSIDRAVEQLGDEPYHGLLNIAGVPGTLPGDTVLAVNFLGMRHLTEALLPRIVQGGSIVIVSSTAGMRWPNRVLALDELMSTHDFPAGSAWFVANPQEGNAYDFSKEAATFYTMRKGIELIPTGIRINAVLPGPVETPILSDFEDSMGKDLLEGVRNLVGRHAHVDDIADVVVFLASDQARWINAQSISVDGGFTGGVLSGSINPAELVSKASGSPLAGSHPGQAE